MKGNQKVDFWCWRRRVGSGEKGEECSRIKTDQDLVNTCTDFPE